jgi:hypothetical protein
MAEVEDDSPGRAAAEDLGEDRRAHARISLDAEVWIGQGGLFSRTTERIANLSIGGAFIELPGRYQVGSIFNLRIGIDGAFVNATAIVRRALPSRGIGVQFLDLSPEAQDYVASRIASRCA